ncbi:unnamed protein product [Acanthoscelides obtectus]|uniref:SH2 domain-containing protein n=1 Tax=Acanthoscelides obtectus TaxID=200917 RepID=A0A9P0PFM2_ACAOB|nr:unnamed protein product [Acanthoscelides obtectus]CAK1677108.1 Tensin-4 [Acanthoscelides obtectus]
MAYAAQLQKQNSFQDAMIASHQARRQPDTVLWTKDLRPTKGTSSATSSPKHTPLKKPLTPTHHSAMEIQLAPSNAASNERLPPPSALPGLKPKYNVLGSPTHVVSPTYNGLSSARNALSPSHNRQEGVATAPPSVKGGSTASQLSTPSSEESNSPTELNSYKKMSEKPPLIKRIAMGLTGNSNHSDDDSYPLVCDSASSTPGSPTTRPLSGGYVNETEESKNKSNSTIDSLKNELVENHSNLTKNLEINNTLLTLKNEREFKMKRISQISSSSSSSAQSANHQEFTPTNANVPSTGVIPPPPPLPERTDSLNNKEEGELRLAPWFQAGIPREIALEILAQEPVGSFMVRDSTSKPGCFALSLRVPRSFQPTGIAHYLIIRANKGYKIKGFTKEFTSLTSLIIHHSVMPELLPCPLSLSRYHPNCTKADSRRDFADIDFDPDYNSLADFRKMMADLNV